MKFLLIAFVAFGGAIYLALRLASVDPDELAQRAAAQRAEQGAAAAADGAERTGAAAAE